MADFLLVFGYAVILGGAYVLWRIYNDKKSPKPPPEFSKRDLITYLFSGRVEWREHWNATWPSILKFITLVCLIAVCTAVKIWFGRK